MRTFPKALAPFREIVKQRANRLKRLTWQELIELGKEPTDYVEIDSRRGSISIIVEPEGDVLKVVIQGFLKHKYLPGSSIAIEGFYKQRNGEIDLMSDHELMDYA